MNAKTQQELLMKPQISEQQFLKDMVERLKDKSFQGDAIESMKPSGLKLKYVWGYQYKGVIDGRWSGKVSGDHSVSSDNWKVELKAGTPVGSDFNNLRFNIVLPCIPQSDKHLAPIGQDMKEMGWALSLDDVNLIPYDEGANIPPEDIVGDLADSPAEYWQKHCNKVTDCIGMEYAEAVGENIGIILGLTGKLPADKAAQVASMENNSSFERQQHLENLNVRTRSTLEAYGNKVLIPYYVLDYEFKGEDYFLMEFANGEGLSHCKIPQRKTLDPAAQVAVEMPDKVKTLNLLKWGWVLAVLVFFILNFVSALVVLALWGGAYWYMGKPVRDRKTELERDIKLSEEANARKLSAQWGV